MRRRDRPAERGSGRAGEASPLDLTELLGDSPPRELRGRVLASLRGRGDFRRGRLAPRTAAAAVLLFASGLALGAALARWGPGRSPVPTAAPSPAPPSPVAADEDAKPTWALMLLDGPGYREPSDAREAERRVAELAGWAGALADSGRLVLADELGPPDPVLPRGSTRPASPTLGLFVIRAADAAEAAAIAARSPHLLHGGRVAVQPIIPH